MNRGIVTYLVVYVFVCIGCTLDPLLEVERGDRAVYTDNQLALNQLALNQLALNQLALNQLALNQLALNQLALNRLALNSLTGIEATEDGRALLRYTARCALPSGTTLIATHDDIDYSFPGSLGLTPHWATIPLTASDTQRLSSCLLAHVNAYGVSVPISVRAEGLLAADQSEEDAYQIHEGAFFGEVFNGSPQMFACQADARSLAALLSDDRSSRVCTDNTPDCGITAVGLCKDVCGSYTDDVGWRHCVGNGVTYPDPINVYLQASDWFGANAICAAASCSMSSTLGADAVFDCEAAGSCASTCGPLGACSIDADEVESGAITVAILAAAEVGCQAADSCDVTCGLWSSCQINAMTASAVDVVVGIGARLSLDCRHTESCRASCAPGSQCLVNCDDAESCQLSAAAAVVQCAGGVQVSGRGCP